jgi:hypothetical protein
MNEQSRMGSQVTGRRQHWVHKSQDEDKQKKQHNTYLLSIRT